MNGNMFWEKNKTHEDDTNVRNRNFICPSIFIHPRVNHFTWL